MATNIFKAAKTVQRKNPKLTWQQAIKQASKDRKKVGAYKVIEKGESKSTPVKKTVRIVRSKTGTFKGMQKVSGINQPDAISRVIMKRQLRKKGLTVAVNISDSDLKKAFTKITGKGLPSLVHIKKELSKGVKPEQIIASYL